MNKLIIATFFLLVASAGFAQETKLIVKEELISDFSQIPAYARLVEEVDGVRKWKKRFAYLDSVNIYRITYLSDGLKINGFTVKPKKPGKYPCVIYNRGGNRDFGALKIIHAIHFLAPIAEAGYVVIASQYRGNAGSEGQEEFGGSDVNDITILPSVLKEMEQADTERIGMYGWSRGGMMTYRALTQMDNIKAAVVGGAVSNAFESIEDRPTMETGVIAELVPNYEANKEAELKKRSAVYWADQFSKEVPILLLHGNADWRVNPTQSLHMALAFEKYKIPYRLIIYEGGDHGIREHREEVDAQIIAWLDKFVKNDGPLPNMEPHGR